MTTWLFWVLLLLVCVAIVGVYLSHMAGRLDRLHLKIESNKNALYKSLLLRANRAQQVARRYPSESKAAQQVIGIAEECLAFEDPNRSSWFGESRLTAAILNLSEQVPPDDGRDEWERLMVACRKVGMARTFNNDTTRMCQNLRKRRIVRWFRLAGYAPYPQPVNFDDRVPSNPYAG